MTKPEARYGFMAGAQVFSELGVPVGKLDGAPYGGAVGHDGRRIAYVAPVGSPTEVWETQVIGGTPRKVFSVRSGERIGAIAWAADDSALAVVAESTTGFSLVFFSPTYSAIRLVALDGTAPREVFRKAGRLRLLTWDRAGRIITAADYPGSSWELTYYRISEDGSATKSSFGDVCAVVASGSAGLALSTEPNCYNIAPLDRSPGRVRVWPLDDAEKRIAIDLPNERIAAAAISPGSKDIAALIFSTQASSSIRLELWADGGAGSRRVVASLPVAHNGIASGGVLTGTIIFRQTGDAAMVGVQRSAADSPYGWDMWFVDLSSGWLSSVIRTPDAPSSAVKLGP